MEDLTVLSQTVYKLYYKENYKGPCTAGVFEKFLCLAPHAFEMTIFISAWFSLSNILNTRHLNRPFGINFKYNLL